METSKKIADSAHTLFIKHGIRSVNMDDIAADLQMSKKTIYKFYASKDALVDGLVTKATYWHHCQCENLILHKSEPVFELFCLLTYWADLYNILSTAVIRDLRRNHLLAYQKLNDYKKGNAHQTIKRSLERGLAAGYYRDDVDMDFITIFFIDSLIFILDTDQFPLAPNMKVLSAEQLSGILISGIVTTAGMNIVNAYKNQRGISLLSACVDGPFWDH